MTLNKPKITGNVWLDTALVFLTVLAIIHTPVIILDALVTGDLTQLNFFRIVGWQSIIPGIDQGMLSLLFSWLAAAGLFLGIYHWLKRN